MPEIHLTSAIIGGGITASFGLVGALVNAYWTRRQNGIYELQKSLSGLVGKLAGSRMDYPKFHRDTLSDVAAAVCSVHLFLFPWEIDRVNVAWSDYAECGHQLETTIAEFAGLPCNPAYRNLQERLDAIVRSTNFIQWPTAG